MSNLEMNIDATSLKINSESTPIHSLDLVGHRATPILIAIIFVIAIGAVFGVGFYREARCMARRNALRNERATIASLRARVDDAGASTMEVVPRIRCKPRKLVRRQELLTIAAAWFVTVPVAAILAAILFTVFAPFIGH